MEVVVATEAEVKPKKKNPKAESTVVRNLQFEAEKAKDLMRGIRALVVGEGEASAEDEEVIADTFEGETTLDDALEAAFKAIDEDQIIVDGIAAREAELGERKARAKKRIELMRALIDQAMISAGVPKIALPIGTASLRENKDELVIDDEAIIPSEYFRQKDPEIDKKPLREAIEKRNAERAAEIEKAQKIANGDEAMLASLVAEINARLPWIPGAHLEPQAKSVTLRRK